MNISEIEQIMESEGSKNSTEQDSIQQDSIQQDFIQQELMALKKVFETDTTEEKQIIQESSTKTPKKPLVASLSHQQLSLIHISQGIVR